MHSELIFLFDAETTGLNSKENRLLTLSGDILDMELKRLESFDFSFAYETYNVDPMALSVNNINLVEHHKKATEDAMVNKEKLSKLFNTISLLSDKWTFAGHNVHFDVQFLSKCHHLDSPAWNKFSHRHLDISSIVLEKIIQRKLPQNIKRSLTDLCAYFNIPIEGSHSARGDVNMSHALLKRLIEL